MARLLQSRLLLLLLIVTTTTAKCYYPNGSEAKDDLPCDADAENSMCCNGSAGSICLSNKLCSGPNGNILRGSCTDKDWHAPECANLCLGASTGGTDLISCSNVTSSDTSYCCDHTVNCCDSGVGRFNVLPSNPRVWARFDREEDEYAVVGTMFTGVPSSTAPRETSTEAVSTSPEATAAETTSTEETTTTTEGARSAGSEAASPTADDSKNDEDNEEEPGLLTGVKIGLGVGVGLGAVLLIALAILSWKYHKARKERQTMSQPVQRFQDPEMVYQSKVEPPSGKPMDYAHFGYVREMPGTTVSWQNQHTVHELSGSPSLHGHGRGY